MQDHASAILAQANKSQGGLMKLVDTQILSEALKKRYKYGNI